MPIAKIINNPVNLGLSKKFDCSICYLVNLCVSSCLAKSQYLAKLKKPMFLSFEAFYFFKLRVTSRRLPRRGFIFISIIFMTIYFELENKLWDVDL